MSLNTDAYLGYLQPWVRAPYDYASQWFTQLTARDIRGRGSVTPTVTSTYRSREKQAELYANRASNPYPVNAPGDSAHEWGLAVDSWVPEQLQPLWTAVRSAVGFRVPPNDVVHSEVPNWRDIVRQARF